jgi:hypothetical protein
MGEAWRGRSSADGRKYGLYRVATSRFERRGTKNVSPLFLDSLFAKRAVLRVFFKVIMDLGPFFVTVHSLTPRSLSILKVSR